MSLLAERVILREVSELRSQYTVGHASAQQRGRRLVASILKRLRRCLVEEHILRSTSLWALTVLLALDPTLRTHMLDLGTAGLLVEILRSAHVSAESYYACELSALLSGASTMVGGVGDHLSLGMADLDPLVSFVPYSLSDSNASRLQGMFGRRGVDELPPTDALVAPVSRSSMRSPLTRTQGSSPLLAIYGANSESSSTKAGRWRERKLTATTRRNISSPDQRRTLSALAVPRTRQQLEEGVQSSNNVNELLPHTLDPLFQAVDEAASVHAVLSAELLEGAEGRTRTRIGAADLAGHDFMRAFFVSKGSLQDAQSLVSRLHTLLRIVDRDASGFVSWGTFSDIILSLAPPHLVRSNVVGFLEAQADAPTALFDYNEFVISGKVLILDEFCHKRELMSTNGWIERQKLARVSGGKGAPLLSWTGHVAWFSKRRSAAVIWLMRAANAALCQGTRVDSAMTFLLKRARIANAFCFLVDCASYAQSFDRARTDAKKALIARSLHGRRYQLVRADALVYLNALRGEVLRVETESGLRRGQRRAIIATNRIQALAGKKQGKRASLGVAYKIYTMQQAALAFLRGRAALAVIHSARQLVCFVALRMESSALVRVAASRNETFLWLTALAERARAFSALRDIASSRLTLAADRAMDFTQKQTQCRGWLGVRVSCARDHVARQQCAVEYLINKGTLRLRVYQSCVYLQHRVAASIMLAYSQDVAIKWLRARVPQAWRHLQCQAEVQEWLQQLGPPACKARARQLSHVEELRLMGVAAIVTCKRRITAMADLRLSGAFARLAAFRREWVGATIENGDRFADEVLRLRARETRTEKERACLSVEEVDRVNMTAAFDWLADLTSGQHAGERLLSLQGFLVLFSQAAYASREFLEKAYCELDLSPCGLLELSVVWNWYWTKGDADVFPQDFSFKNVVAVEDRAAAILFRRFIIDG